MWSVIPAATSPLSPESHGTWQTFAASYVWHTLCLVTDCYVVSRLRGICVQPPVGHPSLLPQRGMEIQYLKWDTVSS